MKGPFCSFVSGDTIMRLKTQKGEIAMGSFDALRRTRDQVDHDTETWLRAYDYFMEDVEDFFENPDEAYDEPSNFQIRQKLREFLAKHDVSK
jgi:hypothetical protein